MANAPALHLEAIERRYRQGDSTLEILRGATLSVWPGESVALIAPSGAGKSTLLHIAGLLEHPDGGEVYIGDKATLKLPDLQRTAIRRDDIGFVYPVPSPVAGILGARERDAAADDARSR